MPQRKNVLTAVNAKFLLLCVLMVVGPTLGLATQTTGNSQAAETGRATTSKKARRSTQKSKSKPSIIRNAMTISGALNIPTSDPGPMLVIVNPDSEKVALKETLDYIGQRMLSYGSQVGYGRSEIIKSPVLFEECDPPAQSPRYLLQKPTQTTPTNTRQREEGVVVLEPKEEAPAPLPNCRMTWTVSYKDARAVERLRKITLTMAHLDVDAVFVSQGVIRFQTTPYKTITVSDADAGQVLSEDEWWIDLHDDEVARRVGRALEHAAKVCRGKEYTEKFAK